ncbi:MAG: YceD family protein [Pseudomonadota bacterium]
MTQSIPDSYNVAALARARVVFDGSVESERLPRFHALLGDSQTRVDVKMQFSYSPLGPAQVVGRLRSSVPQICQRCLQPMVLDVEQHFRIALVDSDAAERKLPDDHDWLRIDDNGRIDLPLLIEDELILSLPQFPWHPEGGCEGQVADVLDGLSGDDVQEQTRRPFSGLDALLKGEVPPGN